MEDKKKIKIAIIILSVIVFSTIFLKVFLTLHEENRKNEIINELKSSYIEYSSDVSIGTALDRYYGDKGEWTLEEKGEYEYVLYTVVVKNKTGIREVKVEFTLKEDGSLERLASVRVDEEEYSTFQIYCFIEQVYKLDYEEM